IDADLGEAVGELLVVDVQAAHVGDHHHAGAGRLGRPRGVGHELRAVARGELEVLAAGRAAGDRRDGGAGVIVHAHGNPPVSRVVVRSISRVGRDCILSGEIAMTTTAALGVLLAVLLFLTAYPMAMLVYGSVHTTPPGERGAFSLDGYRAMLSSANARTLAITVGLSLTKTVLSMALALFLAWIVARTDTPGRALLEML